MRVELVQQVYCFGLTVKQMLKIHKREGMLSDRPSKSVSLRDLLLGLETVSQVKYDGMFGPYIWVYLNEPFKPEILDQVKIIIRKYVR